MFTRVPGGKNRESDLATFEGNSLGFDRSCSSRKRGVGRCSSSLARFQCVSVANCLQITLLLMWNWC